MHNWHGRGTRHEQGYGTAWDRLRLVVLKRDGYLCQCAECKSSGRVRLASQVDHIRPKARGGSDALDNLQAIHAECHRRKTNAEERINWPQATLKVGIDGWPAPKPVVMTIAQSILLPEIPSRARPKLNILAGPPGAGKTTYLNAHKQADDIVIDLAEIKARLSGCPIYCAGDEWLLPALKERNRQLMALATSNASVAWLLVGAPSANARWHWQRVLGGTVAVFATAARECIRRLALDPIRDTGVDWPSLVWAWWRRYSPRPGCESVLCSSPRSNRQLGDLSWATVNCRL
jgi:5-methylcytosine-specific restriction protein A